MGDSSQSQEAVKASSPSPSQPDPQQATASSDNRGGVRPADELGLLMAASEEESSATRAGAPLSIFRCAVYLWSDVLCVLVCARKAVCDPVQIILMQVNDQVLSAIACAVLHTQTHSC